MTRLICVNGSAYFTRGKTYFPADYLENGSFVVYDDDNKRHFLSGVFVKDNFYIIRKEVD